MKKSLLVLVSLTMIVTNLLADATTPLNFTAVNATATVNLKSQGTPNPITMWYSTDGQSYYRYYIDTELELAAGSSVYFKAPTTDGLFSKDASNYYYFEMTGTVAADGNVMSLIDSTMQLNTVPQFAFSGLFADNSSLTTAPALPATVMSENCYASMFSECTSLVTPPALPATTLAAHCYNSMFYACESLTSVPELPATSLADYCYYGMFSDCSSIPALPKLEATDLQSNCYAYMFANCSSLVINTEAPGHKWQIPDGATAATDWNYGMFDYTGGNYTSDPQIGVVYYVQSDTTPDDTIPATAVEYVAGNLLLTIAPNPARISEPVTITAETGSTVCIYTVSGKCIFQIADTSATTSIPAPTESGVYVVTSTDSTGITAISKLIVE